MLKVSPRITSTGRVSRTAVGFSPLTDTPCPGWADRLPLRDLWVQPARDGTYLGAP